MAVDEILRDFPYLEGEDIAEALRYAAEAVREQELPPTHDWMRFLVDASLSPAVTVLLTDAGHDAVRVRDAVGLKAPDLEILEHAAADGR